MIFSAGSMAWSTAALWLRSPKRRGGLMRNSPRDDASSTYGRLNDRARRVPLSMSHIGLYVRDLAIMEDFYTRVLGFTVTDRGKARGADIVFTSWSPRDHHQVALVAGRPKDDSFNHINQISFRVASVEDLQ